MMKLSLAAAAAAGALLFAGAASAVSLADFQLNGSYANGAPSGAIASPTGGSLGATGFSFAANEGLTITGLGTVSAYSLETAFNFDNVDGYRRIVDFSDRASDLGLYVLNGDIDFYNFAFGPSGVIAPGALVTVKLTRTAGGLVTGFINGAEQFSFNDLAGDAIIHDHLNFFIDDLDVPGEASAGFADYITISSAAVPEPGAWALMILGFAGAGAMLRRRRTALA